MNKTIWFLMWALFFLASSMAAGIYADEVIGQEEYNCVDSHGGEFVDELCVRDVYRYGEQPLSGITVGVLMLCFVVCGLTSVEIQNN